MDRPQRACPSPCRLRGRTSRRGGLSNDQRLGTVERPTGNAVPAKRLEAGQLVNNRTTNRVELFRNRFGKGLLASEVGVEDAGLSGAGARAGLNVLSTRGLDVAGALVLANLRSPDVASGRVVVRVTPGRSAGLLAQVVSNLRVDVGGVVRALVRVDLVRAELGHRKAGHVRSERVGSSDRRQG